MPFETALTKALDLRVPVLAAPLGRGSSAQFLAAVASSGSFGFTALAHMPEDTVSDELAIMRRATNGRYGANLTLVVDQRPLARQTSWRPRSSIRGGAILPIGWCAIPRTQNGRRPVVRQAVSGPGKASRYRVFEMGSPSIAIALRRHGTPWRTIGRQVRSMRAQRWNSYTT